MRLTRLWIWRSQNQKLAAKIPKMLKGRFMSANIVLAKKMVRSKVLAAFQAEDLPNVSVSECGCMGLCGSGPMVMVAPDNVYYWRVRANEVPAIAEQHLRGGEPIPSMLHPSLHPHPRAIHDN
jgi:(2Fe-2S) ferredoxin